MIEQVREHLRRTLTQPAQELSQLGRAVRFQIELWRFCARRLHENNLMALSAALSFRTIFALIPILVLAFLAAKSLGVLEDSKRSLRGLLEASGFAEIVVVSPAADAPTPSGAASAADQIVELVEQVESQLTFERIGPVGGALFIWTALTLLITIEESLNRIFNATRQRPIHRRLLLYWSATTLGPVVLASANYLASYSAEAFRGVPGIGAGLAVIEHVGPWIVGVLLLTAVYRLLPTAHVPAGSLLFGATVAVTLWLAAKWGFSVYVQQFVVKGNLYGVLGVFPLFMLWLNLSWVIFLFGAMLAYTAANLSQMRLSEQARFAPIAASDHVAVASAVARSYLDGHGFPSLDEIARRLSLPAETAATMLSRLQAAGVVMVAESDGTPRFALARPPEQILVRSLFDAAEGRNGVASLSEPADNPRAAADAVRSQALASLGGMTLAELASRERRGET